MVKIPITFEHEGTAYKGSLEEVFGAGAKIWHLMIDKFYWGRLRLTDRGWVFDPTAKDESMAALADFFGEYVTLWYS